MRLVAGDEGLTTSTPDLLLNMSWYSNGMEEAYHLCSLDQVEEDENEGVQRMQRVILSFEDLFMDLAAELRIRDQWKETLCSIRPFDTGAAIRPEKIGGEFTLGISIYGWFFEFHIVSPDHIRHMKDDYWAYIVRLASAGKVEIIDYGCGIGGTWDPKEGRKLTQHKGSLVFSLARDYVMNSLAGNEDYSFGGIRAELPIDSSEADARAFFKTCLETSYRSNYLLHRSAYIERKRRLKKALAEL